MHEKPCERQNLRRGWTTGACATAAAKSACCALLTGSFPDPVTITLPRGQEVAFSLAKHGAKQGLAWAGVVKDAGDDPDITHGALVWARVRLLAPSRGVVFRAGAGVGRVTRPGLALAVGEPAINPVPRQMICQALAELQGSPPHAEVTIGVENGAALARRTLNARLGVVGGLSILGTTGVVVPFSCSAWIDSIHRGIDVARAMGLPHIVGAVGDVSERAAQALFCLPEEALIEMGDFVGGFLKYLRRHPVERITIAGGVAKMTKLAQGRLDLHSKRGSVDRALMARWLAELGGSAELDHAARRTNSVAEIFTLAGEAGLPLGDYVAHKAWATAAGVLSSLEVDIDVALFDRAGTLAGYALGRAS